VCPPPGRNQRGANVVDLPVTAAKNGAFQATVAFDRGPGEYLIEVTAEGALGPVVTDLLRVYAGVPYPPPDVSDEPDDKFAGEKQAVKLMLALINQDRRTYQLAPLALDQRLSVVARRHSVDMMQNNFFAHTSPTAGDLTARLKAAEIVLKASGENIALDTSVRRAERNLLESPQHRKNILSADFDRVGLGIVADANGTLYVTQDFGLEFTQTTPQAAAAGLLAELNEARGAARVPLLRRSAELDGISLANSKAMAATGKSGYETASNLLKQSGKGRATLTLVLMSFDRPTVQNVEEASPANTRRFDQVGIGVVGQNATNEPPRWWTTIIFATERP
jgi:uncharacterized protein YkwD